MLQTVERSGLEWPVFVQMQQTVKSRRSELIRSFVRNHFMHGDE
jgi:hypothetical protein